MTLIFLGDIDFSQSRSHSPQFVWIGDVKDVSYALPNLKKGLVSVGNYIRNGKIVQGYRRSDMLQGAIQEAAAATVQSKSGVAMANLAAKTVTEGKVPSRAEIGSTLKIMAQDAAANPVQFLKQGKQREKLLRGALEAATGRPLPSNPEIVAQGFKKGSAAMVQFARENPDVVQEVAVNSAGFVGSLGFGLAGDLGGAVITRKAIKDTRAVLRARQNLQLDEAFQNASRWDKIRQLRREALGELKKQAEQSKDDAIGDVSGWAIGNSSSELLDAVPLISGLPLKGSAVAIPVVPKIVKGAQRLRQGENFNTVVRDTAKEIRDIPAELIRAGNERERKVRDFLDKKILEIRAQYLKDLKREMENA